MSAEGQPGDVNSPWRNNASNNINWSRPQPRHRHSPGNSGNDFTSNTMTPEAAHLGPGDNSESDRVGSGVGLQFKNTPSTGRRGHQPDLSNDSTTSGGGAGYYLPQDRLLENAGQIQSSNRKYIMETPAIQMEEGVGHGSGKWPRPTAPARTYVPVPEMSQIYSGDHTQYINSSPPKHNFNDPDDEYQYDVQKAYKNDIYHHPPNARLSTTSVATGVIDFEDAHDGDPDRVGAIDDDFSHSTTYPLDQARSASNHSNRPTRRFPGDHNFHRWNKTNGEINEDLQRRLGARHLQMIALGGTLGVGLFLASGKALSVAGPLGALIGYSCMGFVVLCVMLSLGEMTALIPIAGGITTYAGRFVDDALGFAAGWMYWLSFATALPTEVTAASILIRYYSPIEDEKYIALWITVFLGMVLAVNCFNVRVYGELEYWFGLLKIMTILGLIILMVIINAGGAPNHAPIRFRNWEFPNGPFRQHLVTYDGVKQWRNQFFEYPDITGPGANFLATWGSFTIAAFSFLGTEIVAVAAGEAANSRQALPSAVRRLFWRIAIFYVLGIFVVGLNVPSTHDRLLQFHDSTVGAATGPQEGFSALGSKSPWVIAIMESSIPILPAIINGIFVFCAWSAGNSHLYASSRTLYGLSLEGKAPRIFRRCTASGVPYVSVLTSTAIALTAYIQLAGPTGQIVFDYLLKLTTTSGLIVWGTFCLAFVRFYYGIEQARHIDRFSDEYPYRSPFQPYLAWIGLFATTVIVLFNGFDFFLTGRRDADGVPISRDVDFAPNFLSAYLSVFVFFALFFFWKFFKNTSLQPLNRINFDTGMAYGIDERKKEEVSTGKRALRFAIRTIG
ncbi:hypothetical protein TWF788_001210 [Orbilia oligospora]|uniref:Amino acid permease/ SLC12A domain-containing protein n=2 Tax=Orbilia oligospora TaxID=2813651 RepID=A0A6G1LQS0_ORBOL|nr:hypothetical protein TWF788_001210 [Orbilia oligospora]KAF3196667.1 hypothetical protein TWF679_004561 [Orbilia oligospora]KAF3231702.1 hypothetical protein TWF192_003433 [Orbilia oligospora]